MKIQTQSSTHELQSIGCTALDVLNGANCGTVLATVTDAIYLRSEKGELSWLIPAGGPMHQRGIQVNKPLPRVKVGSVYEVVDHTLVIGTNNSIRFHHLPVWMSPAVAPTSVISLSRFNENLLTVIHRLLSLYTPAGFGSLILPVIHLITHQDDAAEVYLKKNYLEKSWPAIQGMILSSQMDKADSLIRHAQSLVGLGEGLTPSGDDFLGGFFFARQLLHRYYPSVVKLSNCNYSDFILQSKPLTNLISFTILKDHADGHSIELMHLFANSLLHNESADQSFSFIEKLTHLGHSTGWDILTGFLAGVSNSLVQ